MLIICSVLDVTPYELHGGANGIGSRSNPSEYILVTKIRTLVPITVNNLLLFVIRILLSADVFFGSFIARETPKLYITRLA